MSSPAEPLGRAGLLGPVSGMKGKSRGPLNPGNETPSGLGGSSSRRLCLPWSVLIPRNQPARGSERGPKGPWAKHSLHSCGASGCSGRGERGLPGAGTPETTRQAPGAAWSSAPHMLRESSTVPSGTSVWVGMGRARFRETVGHPSQAHSWSDGVSDSSEFTSNVEVTALPRGTRESRRQCQAGTGGAGGPCRPSDCWEVRPSMVQAES